MRGPSKSKHIFILFYILLFSLFFIYLPATSQTTSPISALVPKIRAQINQYPQLTCGVYVKPSWINAEIDINGSYSFPAASLIKIPIAVIVLQEIDKKSLSWDHLLTIQYKNIISGAGTLRNKKIGTKITLKEAFKKMLIDSDNTAASMIIDLLGGIPVCSKKMANLGLKKTVLVDSIGNFSKSRNTTTPRDMVLILERSLEGDLLSSESKSLLKETLTQVKNKSLIKKGIGRYTKFAHKTGTIGICVGDAGIIYLPFSKRIGISIIVTRPWNDLAGNRIIREISSAIYTSLN